MNGVVQRLLGMLGGPGINTSPVIDESGAFGGMRSGDFETASATPSLPDPVSPDPGGSLFPPAKPANGNALMKLAGSMASAPAVATPTEARSPLQSVLSVLDSTKATPQTQRRRPLETLMLFLAPATEAVAQGFEAPLAQKTRRFRSSLLRGGLNSLIDVVTRPERMRQQRRQEAIEDIALGTRVAEADARQKTAEARSRPNLQHVEGVDAEGNPALGTFDPREGKYSGVVAPKKTQEQRDRFSLQWKGDDESGQLYRVNLDTNKAEPVEIDEGQYEVAEDGTRAKKKTPFTRSKGTKTFRLTDTQTGEVLVVDEKTMQVMQRKQLLTPKPDPEVQDRAEAQQLEQSAQAVIEQAISKVGQKASPEEVANAAVEIVNEQVKKNAKLGPVASKIRNRIREIQRRAKTPDEMKKLIRQALADLAGNEGEQDE